MLAILDFQTAEHEVIRFYHIGPLPDNTQPLASYYLTTQQVTVTRSILIPKMCTAASLKKPTLIYELTRKLNPQTLQTYADQMLAERLRPPFGSLLIFLHPLLSQNEINGVLLYWSDYSDPYLVL